MAEEIVACPGCAKKFRIPDGAPSGSFACTACGADVAYGAAATAAAASADRSSGGGRRGKRSGARTAGKRSAAKRRGATGRAAAEEEPARGGRRRAGRRRGGEDEAPPKKESKTVPLLIAIGGFVLVAFIVIAAMLQDDPKDETAEGTAATPLGGISSDGTTPGPDAVEPEPEPVAPPPIEPVTPEPPPVEDSGIENAENREQVKDYRYYFNRKAEELFVDLPPIEGTTDAEAEAFRKDVRLFIDFDSGRDGMDAENRIEKAGRKAIPFLLSGFAVHYNGKRWEDDKEQWAAFQIQQLVGRMTKADGPPSTFIARYSRGVDVPPKHFERAGRMWIAWWLGAGQYIETFTPHSDDGEEE